MKRLLFCIFLPYLLLAQNPLDYVNKQFRKWREKRNIYEKETWSQFKGTGYYKAHGTLRGVMIPPPPQEYKIVDFSFGSQFKAGCEGLGLSIDLDALVDVNRIREAILSWATNTLFTFLLSQLYQSNVISQVQNIMNRTYEAYLSITSQRCNTAEIIKMSSDERYKNLSLLQKLCVSALLSGGFSYQLPNGNYGEEKGANSFEEALEKCTNPEIIKKFSYTFKSCKDFLQDTSNSSTLLDSLIGYITYETIDGYTKPVLHGGTWSAIQFYEKVFEMAENKIQKVFEMLEGGGTPDALYKAIKDTLADVVIPGAPITVELITRVYNLDELTRERVKWGIASAYALWAFNYVINIAEEMYQRCYVASLSQEGIGPKPSGYSFNEIRYVNKADLSYIKERIQQLRNSRDDLLAYIELQEKTLQPVVQLGEEIEYIESSGVPRFISIIESMRRPWTPYGGLPPKPE